MRLAGYWVLEEARGQGIGAGALEMVMSWAFGSVGVERLELLIEPAKRASVRTAERCGFRQEGLLRRRQKIGAERRDLLMLRCTEETWP